MPNRLLSYEVNPAIFVDVFWKRPWIHRLGERVGLRRIVAVVLGLGPTHIQFVVESGAEGVHVVGLVGIHAVQGTVAHGHIRNQTTLTDLCAGVVQVAEINVIAIREIVVGANCVIVVVDAGGIVPDIVVEVVWIRET